MRVLYFIGAGLMLGLSSCQPALPRISMTAGISTTVASTIFVSTLPPADYTPPANPTSPYATDIPGIPGGLPPTELKYRLLDNFPDFFYCDPDFYPIARDDETKLALEGFPGIQADAEQFQIILAHNDMGGLSNFTDQQKLLIYQEYKKLHALNLDFLGDHYNFQLQIGQEGSQSYLISGSIDGDGNIKVDSKDPTIATCPICLTKGTSIETPQGPIEVQNLKVGDLVWALDASGNRIAAQVLQTGYTVVPATYRALHVLLEDGREIWASPGHPLADGRKLSDLQPGDELDGAMVLSAESVRYGGGATYDILPSGGSGLYWANGILVGSTLKR